MKLHEEWMMQDLHTLQANRQKINVLADDLKYLESEYNALKATRIERIPYASGNNYFLDRLEENLAKRENIQLQLNAIKSHVAYMENLLDQIPVEDKEIIEGLIIKKNMTGEQLAEKLFVDVRTVFNRKKTIIENLLRLRFGAGYRP